MSEKCFCHLNGIAVKDATARKAIAEQQKQIDHNSAIVIYLDDQRAVNTTAINGLTNQLRELQAQVKAINDKVTYNPDNYDPTPTPVYEMKYIDQLTNVSIDNTNNLILEGETYRATITAAAGYRITYGEILDANVSIITNTDMCTEWVIEIENVTSDMSISVYTELIPTTVISESLLPTAEHPITDEILNGDSEGNKGYYLDQTMRIEVGSEGNSGVCQFEARANHFVTGLIPIKLTRNNAIEFDGFEVLETRWTHKIAVYDENKILIHESTYPTIDQHRCFKVVKDSQYHATLTPTDVMFDDMWYAKHAYIQFSGTYDKSRSTHEIKLITTAEE